MCEKVKKLMADLAEPFEPSLVGWKPGKTAGNRCLAIPYIDARDVAERLDLAVGLDGWRDEYDFHPDGNVVCRLTLKVGDAWITKVDVGGPSDQPDDGDKAKAAVSDALKRAAVKFGIGRYLYRLPESWADFDPQKKRIITPPGLPDWAKPKTRVKEEPVDLHALAAGVAILALAVPEGVEALTAAAKTLSPTMKRAIGKERYDAYVMLAESHDASRKAKPTANGKHKPAAAAAN